MKSPSENEEKWLANSYRTSITIKQEEINDVIFPKILKEIEYYFENKHIKFYQFGIYPTKQENYVYIRLAYRDII